MSWNVLLFVIYSTCIGILSLIFYIIGKLNKKINNKEKDMSPFILFLMTIFSIEYSYYSPCYLFVPVLAFILFNIRKFEKNRKNKVEADCKMKLQ